MLQKLKVTSYALLILLLLVLPSQAIAESGFAKSCKGWNCTYEGQVCPQGVPGASAGNYICLNSKWVPTKCTERKIMDLYNSCREIVVPYGGARSMHKCVQSIWLAPGSYEKRTDMQCN